MCAFIVRFRLNSVWKKHCMIAFYAVCVSWYNRIKQINTFGAKKMEKKVENFVTIQHNGKHFNTHMHTLDTDETVHSVRMIRANNASTRKRAISCKWTQKEKERDDNIGCTHFTTHKCIAPTQTNRFQSKNWIHNRVAFIVDHIKSLFFLHTLKTIHTNSISNVRWWYLEFVTQ